MLAEPWSDQFRPVAAGTVTRRAKTAGVRPFLRIAFMRNFNAAFRFRAVFRKFSGTLPSRRAARHGWFLTRSPVKKGSPRCQRQWMNFMLCL